MVVFLLEITKEEEVKAKGIQGMLYIHEYSRQSMQL